MVVMSSMFSLLVGHQVRVRREEVYPKVGSSGGTLGTCNRITLLYTWSIFTLVQLSSMPYDKAEAGVRECVTF